MKDITLKLTIISASYPYLALVSDLDSFPFGLERSIANSLDPLFAFSFLVLCFSLTEISLQWFKNICNHGQKI